MDESLLNLIDSHTLVIVPTGSLATHLKENYAAQQIALGKHAWEAPNIVSWNDSLKLFWQHNRSHIHNLHSLVSVRQSKLFWERVVEKSARDKDELTLLNVQQTVRACMRSHRIISDWRCDESALKNEHIEDLAQFLEWRSQYVVQLEKRCLADDSMLQSAILACAESTGFSCPVRRVVWYAYDLLTAAQTRFNQLLEEREIKISYGGPKNQNHGIEFCRYQDEQTELRTVLQDARNRLEQNPQQQIGIVIPDLQHRYARVQQTANEVFYPNASLTSTNENKNVFRFSLGSAMSDLPAIESALSILEMLKPMVSTADLGFVLQSPYAKALLYERECGLTFYRWLQRKKVHKLSLKQLPELYTEFRGLANGSSNCQAQDQDGFNQFLVNAVAFSQELDQQLHLQVQETGYRTLSFDDWGRVFVEWLSVWQWSPSVEADEVQSASHQLQNRWQLALQEYASLGLVQSSIGLSGALAHLKQSMRDTVFLPQSANSPLLISGLLEALGREIDVCYLTGMTQDFPPPNRLDAFIPSHHLLATGWPDASPQVSAEQSKRVMQSLVAAAGEVHISFALLSSNNPEVSNQPSPLYAKRLIDSALVQSVQADSDSGALEYYVDEFGPPWRQPEKARGGSAIFKNQSLCAFKAFATHQLRFETQEEPEFGLNHLDRGNLSHKMMEMLWQRISSQAALLALNQTQQRALLDTVFDELLQQSESTLSETQLKLFGLEKKRVLELCAEWLELERQRPVNFTVIERESRYSGIWAGIAFDYAIDRIDITDTGQRVIVDYKTGQVSRKLWQGERLREPQLPLYALARTQATDEPLSGIAFGQLRRGACQYVELAESNILKSDTHRSRTYQQQWQEGLEDWPEKMTQLASDFLQGKATVDPLDEQACQYCDLSSVCRINELRSASQSANSIADSDGGEQT